MSLSGNKKNLNRLQRRTAKYVESHHSQIQPDSQVSTFRMINPHHNKILQGVPDLVDKIPINMNGFLQYCHKINPNKRRYIHLSNPKSNSLNKIYNTKKDHELSQFASNAKSLKKINQTISFSFGFPHKIPDKNPQPTAKPLSFFKQDNIDLKNEEFKRRHRSLKIYEKSLLQDEVLQKNEIFCSEIPQTPIGEILQKNKQKQEREKLILAIFKNGQALQRDLENDDFRSVFIQSNNKYSQKNKFEEIELNRDIFDKSTTQKYKKLIDSIHETEFKYPIEPYDQYIRNLTQRYTDQRAKKKSITRNLLSSGYNWRH